TIDLARCRRFGQSREVSPTPSCPRLHGATRRWSFAATKTAASGSRFSRRTADRDRRGADICRRRRRTGGDKADKSPASGRLLTRMEPNHPVWRAGGLLWARAMIHRLPRAAAQGLQAFVPVAVLILWLRSSGRASLVKAAAFGVAAAVPATIAAGLLFSRAQQQAQWEAALA